MSGLYPDLRPSALTNHDRTGATATARMAAAGWRSVVWGCVLFGLLPAMGAAQTFDWPAWRGPTGDGKSQGRAAPIEWSADQNIRWQVEVPGRGHSSPIVVDDAIYLTTADEDKQTQSLPAFDRHTGQPRWTTEIHAGAFMEMHRKNSHASATPICDGEQVYCVFIHGDGLWVTATDLEGEIRWQKKVGEFGAEHGYGSSPVLYEDTIIVAGDNLTGSFVAALRCGSGDTAWKTDRPTSGRHGSYATPTVVELAGRQQLLLMGMSTTASYNPADGTLIWSCAGPAEVTACTVAVADGLVFASGGYPEKELMAIRADGEGELAESSIVWSDRRGVTYVPTPLVHEGRLYVVGDKGVTTCYLAATGEIVWRERLDGSFSASPTLSGGMLYVPDEEGRMYVIRAADRYNLVALNDLGDGGFATPTICDGQIFLRTNHRLYCISDRAE